MWIGRSPRSALISHLYLLSNPLWQPPIARDSVWEAMLLTQGYISITEGSESDEQLICLINPSFSKKNIWSWGADLLSCSYWQVKWLDTNAYKPPFRFIFVWDSHTNRSISASKHPLIVACYQQQQQLEKFLESRGEIENEIANVIKLDFTSLLLQLSNEDKTWSQRHIVARSLTTLL